MNEPLTEMPGIAEASAELDRLMAEDAKESPGQSPESGAGQSAETAEAPRAEPGEGAGQATNTEDEKLAAEKLKAETDTKTEEAKAAAGAAETKPEAKPSEKAGEKSRYAKAQERLGKTWEEVNAEKAALKAERDAIQAERQKIEQERTEFTRQREQAEQEFTPEQYEAAAKKFEAEGKFDLADLAKGKAQQLRANPPAARAAANQAQEKEWALKAGTDFPELMKANSPLQVRVSQLLQTEPELKAHPKGIYLAARLADLEGQAAKGKALADTVAAKDKELVGLKARVAELEGLTTPGGANGATRMPAAKDFAHMTPDEQWSDLQRTAAEAGVLR